MSKKIILATTIILILAGMVMVLAWTPTGDIVLNNFYKIVNASSISTQNLTVNDKLNANLSWNSLYDYPVACPNGTAITQLGDSVICSSTFAPNSSLGDYVKKSGDSMEGNLSMKGNYICLDDPINCSAYMYYNGSGIIIYSSNSS